MSNKKTYSEKDVCEAWSTAVGRVDQYDLVKVESFDGTKQIQLIDKDSGSIVIAVNGTDQEALRKLFEGAGTTFIDGAVTPKEASGEDSERRYTSRGTLASPTQPEVLVDERDPIEVNNSVGKASVKSEPKAPVTNQESKSSVTLGESNSDKKEK